MICCILQDVCTASDRLLVIDAVLAIALQASLVF